MAIDLNQGLYTDKPRILGQVPGYHPNQRIVTFADETDDIDFGMAVMQGTLAEQALKYAGAAGVFRGAAAFSVDGSKENATTGQVDGYEDGDDMGVCNAGFINVYAIEAVNENDPVRIVHTDASVPANVGKFAKTASAGETTLLAGARFAETISAAGIVAIELDPTILHAITDDV